MRVHFLEIYWIMGSLEKKIDNLKSAFQNETYKSQLWKNEANNGIYLQKIRRVYQKEL